MCRKQPAILALADGSIFLGESVGAAAETVGEVVFNTAMTGYEEILTDPSYAEQLVTLTYPHIGNVGISQKDAESEKIWAAALIIRDLSLIASSWRSTKTLQEYLKEKNVVAIAGIDTRRLTRLLREKGSQNGCIITGTRNSALAIKKAQEYPGLKGMDLAKHVCVTGPEQFSEGLLNIKSNRFSKLESAPQYHIVAYDFGIKKQILRLLVARGCRITLVPGKSSVETILTLKPDGILLSNGPGDPAACSYAIQNIRHLLRKNIPIFGICLGFQLMALACGAKTVKMKCGHHGANHPVQDVDTKQVYITSQNHSFAVDPATLPKHIRVTHRSLFDNTLQGIALENKPAFGFQGHPEASPGPHDILNLFDRFIQLMKTKKLSCQKEKI